MNKNNNEFPEHTLSVRDTDTSDFYLGQFARQPFVAFKDEGYDGCQENPDIGIAPMNLEAAQLLVDHFTLIRDWWKTQEQQYASHNPKP